MPKPAIDFQILRHIAESASGMRDQDTWFIVSEKHPNDDTEHHPENHDDGKVIIYWQHKAPTVDDPNTTVIYCQAVKDSRLPEVKYARIGMGPYDAETIDLLDVYAKESVAQFDPPVAHGRADAVFWSVSAVEKFLTPYYASVYGDDGGRMVEAVLRVLRPTEADLDRDAADDRAPAFAVVHLPNSEWVGENDPDVLMNLATIHGPGDVRRVRAHPRGGYDPDGAPQKVGSRDR